MLMNVWLAAVAALYFAIGLLYFLDGMVLMGIWGWMGRTAAGGTLFEVPWEMEAKILERDMLMFAERDWADWACLPAACFWWAEALLLIYWPSVGLPVMLVFCALEILSGIVWYWSRDRRGAITHVAFSGGLIVVTVALWAWKGV